MVLARPDGGTGRSGAPSAERGSQTLELALLLPAVVLVGVVVLHAGVLATDLVAAQMLAREAARALALGGEEAAGVALAGAAGARAYELTVEPGAGEIVIARVKVRSAAFAAFGLEVWLPGRVAMRSERR